MEATPYFDWNEKGTPLLDPGRRTAVPLHSLLKPSPRERRNSHRSGVVKKGANPFLRLFRGRPCSFSALPSQRGSQEGVAPSGGVIGVSPILIPPPLQNGEEGVSHNLYSTSIWTSGETRDIQIVPGAKGMMSPSLS